MQLYKHQKQFVDTVKQINRISGKTRVLLADDVGVGKTPETIVALDEVCVSKQSRYSLVVVPKSMIYKWAEEFQKWSEIPAIPVPTEYSVSRRANYIEKFVDTPSVVITNYATVRGLTEFEEKPWGKKTRTVVKDSFWLRHTPYAIVIDEAHKIRNKDAQITMACHAIAAEFDAARRYMGTERPLLKHRFLLTATPMESTIDELWSLLFFLDPEYKEFTSYWDFRKKWCEIGWNGWGETVLGNKNERAFRNNVLSRYMIRRRKDEVRQYMPDRLPPEVISLPMDTRQRKHYDKIQLTGIEFKTDGTPLITPNVISQLIRLKQIAVNPALCELTDTSPKFEYVLDILETGDRPLVIYSQFKTALDLLQVQFKKKGFSCVRITGDEGAQQRQVNINTFNRGEADVALITEAGGQGVDLQKASSHLVFLDVPWSRITWEQVHGRIDRPGQKDPIRYTYLAMQNSIDQRLVRIMQSKSMAVDKIIPTLVLELIQ